MADFFLLADPDPERRQRYRAAAAPFLSTLTYPIRHDVGHGCVEGAVFCHDQTPFHASEWESGTHLITIGLEDRRRFGAHADPNAPTFNEAFFRDWFSGTAFGVCIGWNARGDIFVAADRLGIFPIYFFQQGDVTVIASTPSLILCHASCGRGVDRIALTGILRYSFPCGERTMWDAIRRLSPGFALKKPSGAPLRRREIWRPREDESPETGTEGEYAAVFEATLRSWAGRQAHPVDLQLSGGLDSRIVAGLLSEASGGVGEAWTYGRRWDLEARSARSVARECGFPHRTLPVDTGRYLEWAYAQIAAGHLTNAVTDFALWAAGDYAASRAFPVASGYLGDITMGGNHIGRSLPGGDPRSAFVLILSRLNAGYGLPDRMVNDLLRGSDARDLMEACDAELYRTFLSRGTTNFRRGWWFDLLHRDRHNVARLILVMARHTWPLLPYLQPGLIDIAENTPASMLGARRLQEFLINERFPRLAALPFDRGQMDRWPLRFRSPAHRLGRRVGERAGRIWRHTMHHYFGLERRVNYRLWDINRNPGWLAIRGQAQHDADALADLMDVSLVTACVPGPDAQIPVENALQGSGLKTLAGLALWAAVYR